MRIRRPNFNAHSTISTITEQHLAVDHACSLTTHVCGEETSEKNIVDFTQKLDTIDG